MPIRKAYLILMSGRWSKPLAVSGEPASESRQSRPAVPFVSAERCEGERFSDSFTPWELRQTCVARPNHERGTAFDLGLRRRNGDRLRVRHG